MTIQDARGACPRLFQFLESAIRSIVDFENDRAETKEDVGAARLYPLIVGGGPTNRGTAPPPRSESAKTPY